MSLFGLDPHVGRYLIVDEGEVIVDEVHKHWAAIVGPVLELLAIIPVLLLLAWLPPGGYWLPLLGALALLVHGLWRILSAHMDRFVVTNIRVFRVHGILSQHVATMPISRILDISVHVPFVGRIINYGHFVFESAAQEQGLREIRYVGSPTQRGLTIQRVIQRSGLRGATNTRAQEAAALAAPEPRSITTPPAAPATPWAPIVPVAPVVAPTKSAPNGQSPSPSGPNDQTAPIDLPWWRSPR